MGILSFSKTSKKEPTTVDEHFDEMFGDQLLNHPSLVELYNIVNNIQPKVILKKSKWQFNYFDDKK